MKIIKGSGSRVRLNFRKYFVSACLEPIKKISAKFLFVRLFALVKLRWDNESMNKLNNAYINGITASKEIKLNMTYR